MENAATEGLQKYSNDVILKYFKAYAIVLQGKYIVDCSWRIEVILQYC